MTVLLPGASRVLSLCEVEVYPVHFGTALTGSLITLTEETRLEKQFYAIDV